MNSEQKVTAIFDLDGTITSNDTYLSFLLTYLKRNPYRLLFCWSLPFVVAVFKAGLKNNTWVKKRFLAAVMGGISRDKLNVFVSGFIETTLEKKVKKAALDQIQQHKQLGHDLILATASFDFYTRKLGEKLGFDSVICTHSKWNDNKLVGDIDGQNCYGKFKLEKVSDFLKDNKNNTHTILYTDHHSDKPLMDWVNEAIAIDPTSKMRELAASCNYEIREWC